MLPLQEVTLNVRVQQGRNLVAKDRNLFGFGKARTSDPFVKVIFLGKEYGKTKVISKTLSPVWHESFHIQIKGEKETSVALQNNLVFSIWDHDEMSDDDSMGVVTIPFKDAMTATADNILTKWYPVEKGSGKDYCKNASGELEVAIAVTNATRILALVPGNCHPIRGHSNIYVGLSWDFEYGKPEIDLDASCVALSCTGEVLMKETVYYGNLSNANNTLFHSGDERTGETVGDDEIIICKLSILPSEVYALYFILCIATPEKTFSDVKSTRVRILDEDSQQGVCQFMPATTHGNYTSMFLARFHRQENSQWMLSPIEKGHSTARDFGSVIPQMKSLSRDIVPNIIVNPTERVAIMRKNGVIRISDYCSGEGGGSSLPDSLTFGLAWDVTNGINIDLDASVICLDSNYQLKDLVFFKKLRSDDGAIVHGGDEREGDEIGDDEKIHLSLNFIDPDIKYMGIIVNSYSGQELDDVAGASCHLFDPNTHQEIAIYALTNASALDKHTALLMSCMYRTDSGDWCLMIISEPAQGRVAKNNVQDLQNFLMKHPPREPSRKFVTEAGNEEEIDLSMPSYIPHNADEEIVVLSDEELKQYGKN